MEDKEYYDKLFREVMGRMMAFGGGLLACIVIAACFEACNGGLRKENERLREEIARQQQYVPLQRDTIRDTIEVVTQKVVEIDHFKEVLTKEDKELLKDLDVKLKDLQAYEKIGTQTAADVVMEASDTDSVLTYRDEWLDLSFDTETNAMSLTARDSLVISVEKEYRKRFLWWRWGAKGYEVKAVSFSPYTTIRYNNYVKTKDK